MSKEFRQLVAVEKEEQHKRQIKASPANLMEVSIICGLFMLASVMFGSFDELKPWYIASAFFCVFVPMWLINSQLWKTQENGQWVYILEKYEFLPVDRKDIYWAKAYIEITKTYKFVLAQQVIALLFRWVAVSEDGGAFLTPYLFMPLIFATVCEAVNLIAMYSRQDFMIIKKALSKKQKMAILFVCAGLLAFLSAAGYFSKADVVIGAIWSLCGVIWMGMGVIAWRARGAS